MGWITEARGRLLAVGLFGVLIWQIITAVEKLQSERTSETTKKHYNDIRFMPSISICFSEEGDEYVDDENDSTLNKLKLDMKK